MQQAWFALSAITGRALVLCEIGTAACMQKCLSSHDVSVRTCPARYTYAYASDAHRTQMTVSQIDETLNARDARRTQVTTSQIAKALDAKDARRI